MTFSRGCSTEMETLAFEARSGACRFCGGAGVVPDPVRPRELRACPRCAAAPRRRAPGPPGPSLGAVVWHMLVCSFFCAAAILTLLLPVALWQAITG